MINEKLFIHQAINLRKEFFLSPGMNEAILRFLLKGQGKKLDIRLRYMIGEK